MGWGLSLGRREGDRDRGADQGSQDIIVGKRDEGFGRATWSWLASGCTVGISCLSKNPFFIPRIGSLRVPNVPAVTYPSIPTGTTEGKSTSAPRRHGTAAGVGMTRIPLPAAGIRAGALRTVLPVGGAGAGTAAVGTRPRGARRGRGAGAGPLRPVGSGNATTPIRRTEREPGFFSRDISHRLIYFLRLLN